MAELPAAATVGHRKRRREDIEPHIDLAEDEHNQKQETKSKHKCHCHMYFDVMPLMEKEYIQKIGKENCYVSPALVKAMLDERSRPLANIALEYYNKKQGVNFVCLDPMLSNDLSGAWDDGDVGWFHANFKAHDPGSADPSEKLFFAEVYVSEGRNCKGFTVDHVKTVQVLDISDPGVVKGCRYCRHIYHPEGGYKAGVVPKGWTPPGEGSTHGEQCFEGHADLEFVVEFD